MLLQFLVRRFALIALTLFLVSVLIFCVTEVLPGDAAAMVLGPRATPETLSAMRVRLGLDQPPSARYVAWISGIVRGDWGESLLLKQPVGPLLGQRLRNSAVLALIAWVISAVAGIGMGIVASLYRDRWLDRLLSIFTLFFVAFPPFIIAIFLIVVFAAWLGWLPATSMIDAEADLWSSISFLVLPTLALTLGALAEVMRLTRSSFIEIMRSDYIRVADSKGLPSKFVILRHALPNALLPTISVLALNIGYLMSGVVLVEVTFAYPGLGKLMLQAVLQRDLPLLQATALVVATIYAMANLTADILYRVLNPQIRYG